MLDHLEPAMGRVITGLLELVNDLTLALSLDASRLIYCNQAAELIYGVELKQLVARPDLWLEMIHHDDQRTLLGLLETIEQVEQFELEFRIVRRDGEQRWMQGRFQLLRDTDSASVAIGAIAKDVTNRIAAERKLEDQRAIYHSLVESLPINVFRKDRQGRLVFCNKKYCETLGKPLADVLGKDDFDLFEPQLAEKYRKDDQWVLQTGLPFHDIEYHRSGEDEYRYVEVLKTPVKDARGRRIGIQGLFWDVTDRKKAELAMEEAKNLAEAASQAKSDFLANVSHEIRTPMNAIIGITDLLLQSDCDYQGREYLEMIQQSGQSLLTLINDILDFSKIEAGKLVLVDQWFDVRDWIGDTIRTMAFRAYEKGLELILNVDPGLPQHLLGDPDRLRQILVNLVGNAIKFTERGEVIVEVAAVERSDASVRLNFGVSDTGIGIPAEKLESIFHEFEQVDASATRNYGGTGLGLAIASRLVALMGGQLRVDSHPGTGSQFHFTLDMRFDPHREPERRQQPLSGRAIMVAVNNPRNRDSIERILRSWGVNPYIADSNRQAVKVLTGMALADAPIELLLAETGDSQMQGAIDGVALARELLRQMPVERPRIILLARGNRPGDVDMRDLDVETLMLQPVKEKELLGVIQATLELSHSIAVPMIRPAIRTDPLDILLAEDNVINQRLAVALLGKHCHQVTVAETGARAIELFRNGSFDLILMDVQMPVVDGIQATRRIRELESGTGQRTPIIAMTAHALPADRQRCLAAGMDEYLAKPIRASQLDQIIDDVVGTRTSEKSRERSRDQQSTTESGCVDWSHALATVAGDRQLLRTLIDVFLQEQGEMVGEMRRAIERRDHRELRRASHSLKGALSHLGCFVAQARAQQIEDLGEDRWSEANGLIGGLERDLQDLRAELDQFKAEGG